MRLDSRQYPRTTAWLSRLPDGHESHPEVMVRTEAHDDLRRVFIEAGVDDLPQPYQGFVDGRFREEWMSEVLGNALLLMARDRIFPDDGSFLAWVADNMDRLTRKPLHRMVLRLFSPSLILTRTTERWAAFHRGTTLTAGEERLVGGRRRTTLTLDHPTGLYEPLLLENLCTVYRVVLSSSRACDVRLEPEPVGKTRSQFHVSWKA